MINYQFVYVNLYYNMYCAYVLYEIKKNDYKTWINLPFYLVENCILEYFKHVLRLIQNTMTSGIS